MIFRFQIQLIFMPDELNTKAKRGGSFLKSWFMWKFNSQVNMDGKKYFMTGTLETEVELSD